MVARQPRRGHRGCGVRAGNWAGFRALSAWKGKLRGKIVLYGQGAVDPEIDPDKLPAMEHDDSAKLARIAQFPLNGNKHAQDTTFWRNLFVELAFKGKVGRFFAAEGVVAGLVPGGSGGVLGDDTGSSLGWYVYDPAHRQAVPEQVIASEAWDRMERLLKHKVPVSVRLSIDVEFGGEHEHGFNTIAEIPGTDPTLKDEVVMVGGHLDSWIAGTGATDNGAGRVVAMRILAALRVQPRRTIRIALWSGEEQGLLGSQAYVAKHFDTLHYGADPKDAAIPQFLRTMNAPPTAKPEAAKLDAYYNLDNGTGKLLGILCGGQ